MKSEIASAKLEEMRGQFEKDKRKWWSGLSQEERSHYWPILQLVNKAFREGHALGLQAGEAQGREKADTCVVCGASLLSVTTLPHCEDCILKETITDR